MSKTRTKKSDARQRIVETAERLFYAEGVRAVGIDRIIAEAEVAKMSLYNHFSSKDDLILAVLQYREEKFDALFETWMKRHVKTGKDRLEAFLPLSESGSKAPAFEAACSSIRVRSWQTPTTQAQSSQPNIRTGSMQC